MTPVTLRRRCAIKALLTTALVPSESSALPPAITERRWPTLKKTLQEFVHERSAAGVSVAISYHGSQPGYVSAGTLAFNSELPFDENSICRIYSMTKHVTRVAALMLAEDRKLTLDQPVADVLPEFKNLRVAIDFEKSLDARPARKVMTMRHLITNTSGLRNWTPASDSGEELHRLYRERGITPVSYGAGRFRPGFGAQPATLDENDRACRGATACL